jgi:hypothetical protein
MDWPACAIGHNLVEDIRKLGVVFFACHVADVRRAYDVSQRKDRIPCIENRLFFVNVDGGHAGPSVPQSFEETRRCCHAWRISGFVRVLQTKTLPHFYRRIMTSALRDIYDPGRVG